MWRSRTPEAPPSPPPRTTTSKKIPVKVYMVRAETEEIAVEQQKAGNTAITTHKDIKNKVDVVFAKEKSEELDMQKQKLKTTTLKTNIITTKNTHAKSKKIAVKVYKNKHDEKLVVNSKSKKIAVKVFPVAKTEEINVEKQNAGSADTHNPPEHLQDLLNQGVHCQ
jgi:autotransporter translocation and assembly factor TamB